MTAPDTSVEAVAAGLSEAQRGLILNKLSENWSDVPPLLHAPNAMKGWASTKIGLLESHHGHDFYKVRLTPLGLAVRQYLQEQPNG